MTSHARTIARENFAGLYSLRAPNPADRRRR